jgi:hypothetical protein
MYALAASAAGVSVLASARPAQGKVIYTPTHHVIRLGSKYDLDLNHDGKKDFTIYDFSCALTSRCVTAGGALGIQSVGSGHYNFVSAGQVGHGGGGNVGSAIAFHKGAPIPGGGVTSWDAAALVGDNLGSYYGYWYPNVKNRYVGLGFMIGNTRHYGWARMSVRTFGTQLKFNAVGILTGYAYETIPNKPIIAGKTTGPDVVTVQPASLGHLALGRK